MFSAEIVEAKVNCLHSFVVGHALGMSGGKASEPFQVGTKLLIERLNVARAYAVHIIDLQVDMVAT
jgi:hypothetical protein